MASATDGSSRPEQALDVRLAFDAIPALAWSSHSDGSVDFVNQRWHDYTGEARTIISMFSRLLDRINSEGAGGKLCAKSAADSWRVGA